MKQKDMNTLLVGLGNTRLSADYAQNPPWTLEVSVKSFKERDEIVSLILR